MCVPLVELRSLPLAIITTISVAPVGSQFLAGVHPFGPVNVPVGAFAASARLSSAIQLSPTLVVSAAFELSLDGGASWTPSGSAELISDGTIGIDPKTGLPYTDWWVKVGLDEPSNPNRRIKGSVTINEMVTTFIN